MSAAVTQNNLNSPPSQTQPHGADAPDAVSASSSAASATDRIVTILRNPELIPPPPSRPRPRKRKSPTTTTDDSQQQQPPPPSGQAQGQAHPPPPPHPGQQQMPPQHAYPGLPPPAGNVYPPPIQYAYGPPPPGQDYTPGGMMPPQMMQAPSQTQQQQQQDGADRAGSNRQLSTSKRAEQNRKAQRAFRERRDQHVKALESRSQLLDAALASADEANRRWEECRALVDQLRIENTALRSALQQTQTQLAAAGVNTGKPDDGDGNQQPSSGPSDASKESAS